MDNLAIAQNVALFRELVQCGTEIPLWCYDDNGRLLSSNCQNESVFATAFSMFGSRDKMLALAKSQQNPVFLGTALGMNWGAAFAWENDRMKAAYVIGPVFFSDVSIKQIETGLSFYKDLELSVAWKKHFIEALGQIAVSPSNLFSRYLLMLHYCVTGEHLLASDIHISVDKPKPTNGSHDNRPHRDRHKVWLTEQALMQMVRTGDLNYKTALNNSMLISSGVPVVAQEPLRNSKTSVTVFCTLVARAAIEGGLSPDEAFSLSDFYIQSAENATTMDEVNAVPLAMYDDFIRRVHRCRTNPKLSPPVQKCMDYIEMHLTERICAADLAKLAGYSEYYITRKFHEETHYTISNYIKFAKIERAKILLTSTEASVQELAEQLGFSTRSYFSNCFSKVVGRPPADYRANSTRR